MKLVHSLVTLLFLSSASCTLEIYKNSTEILSRNKRFIVFNYGGQMRFVFGYLGPIDLPIWQNLNIVRNFQVQYNLPPKIVSIYDKFKERKFVDSPGDSSRKFVYEFLERMLDRAGIDGHDCLLRTICEVGETPLSHNGLIGELLQLVFTPGQHEAIEEDYRDAHEAGQHGVDCSKVFQGCPLGYGLLDSNTLIGGLKLNG